MSVKMTETERTVLWALLDRLSDVLGNAGCNDFYLPDTLENRALFANVYAYCCPNEPPFTPRAYNGALCIMDHMLLAYLRAQLENHLS